jgi:hypothetical protein
MFLLPAIKKIMKIIVHLVFFCLCFCPFIAIGQNDTVKFKAPKFRFFAPDSSAFKRAFSFQFDNRNSFIRNSPVNIQGIGIGYALSPKFKVGIGAYKINNQYHRKVTRAGPKVNPNIITDLYLYYFTPNVSYTFFENRWFEFSIPFEVGYGYAYTTSENVITQKTARSHQTDYFVPAEIGLAGTFKLNRWLGFSASAGYRKLVWQTSATTKDGFDGYYYNSGVNVYFGTILKDIKYVRHYHKVQKQK